MTAEAPTVQMSDAEYFAAPGLSQSGMKDLAVSPLRYWHLHVNPNRPAVKPTEYMQFGSAVHCAVLQPDEFDKRYARELDAADFPDCLDTIDDLRRWLKDKGITPKGTLKAGIIAQVEAQPDHPPIWDALKAKDAIQNAGKITFNAYDWTRIGGAAHALRNEPALQAILASGQAEVPFFLKDEFTGVPLKAKMDWITPSVILDLKTFSQKAGKSIDRSIADAIYYEAYYRQAYVYSKLRGWPKAWNGEFILAFVESEEPHEVRLRSLRSKNFSEGNQYWTRAELDVRGMINLYSECVDRFGTDPWRYAQDITPLEDEDMPGIIY